MTRTATSFRILWAILCPELAGCAAVQPLLDHALQPNQHCAANGATVTWRDGKAGYSAGCIEQAPYPGMPRPGH